MSIDSIGVFAIDDLTSQEPLYANITTTEELEFFLKTLKERQTANGQRLSVLIEAAPDVPVQELVEVLDVCDRLALPKKIHIEAILEDAPS